MKAAVIFQKGTAPQYINYPVPIVQNEDECLLTMKAAAIKHLDKSQAKGQHYTTAHDLSHAKIIGGDGVGITQDGTRVYAIGSKGMAAEKAIAKKDFTIPLPDGLDDITAAALPNAVMGSAMALLFRADMKKDETVLINGATSFTGKIAIQIAKMYGAKKIIATGRNKAVFAELKALGADEIISLNQNDADIISQIKQIHKTTPIEIVADYLWGHPAELLLAAIKGNGDFGSSTRYVSIGAITGDTVELSSEILRSAEIHISGSGLGSWNKEQIEQLLTHILPQMFQLAAEGRLKIETVERPIQEITNIWNEEIPNGKRLVVRI